MDTQHHSDPTVGGPTQSPKLEIIDGPQKGRYFSLKFKTRIGRETDNEICLADPRISRYHCQISYEDGKWVLTDLGSANGTLFNDMPVAVPKPITHQDQIQLGETVLLFIDPLAEQYDVADATIPSATNYYDDAEAPPPASNVPRLAWITGGLILILLVAIAAVALSLRKNEANQNNTAGRETPVLIRTTPNPESNLVIRFEDDFSVSDSGWDDAFGKFYTKQYGNNQYHIEITTNNLVVWGLANRNVADFEVEVEASRQTGPPGNTYGLIFRYVNHDNYYRFDVSDDGFFLLSKFEDAHWSTLVDWTSSPAIHHGEQATNVLKISAYGSEIAVFANGEELVRTTDNAFSNGNFGFFASTFEQPGIWVSFDNLRLWAPPEQEIALIPTASPIRAVADQSQAPQPDTQTSDADTADPKNTPQAVAGSQDTALPDTKASPEAELVENTPTPQADEPTPEPTVEASPTPLPTDTPVPLPDFVSRDQPLARGQQALSGKIVYPQYDPARGTYDIYRADIDGSNRELLAAEASQPAMNSAGTHIAYRSWKSDQRGLITKGLGESDQWLFVNFFEAASPAFGPDQQFFAFHSRQGGQTPALYRTYGTEHEVYRRESIPVQGEMISFGPSGQMAYRGCVGGTCGITLSNIDGNAPQQLTTNADDTAPAISPDGTTVAFMSNRDGNWEIYTINLESQVQQRLTNESGNDGLPAWSPDGSHIAFASNRDGTWAIWVMTATGENKHQLFVPDGPIDGIVQVDIAHSFGWLEEHIVWTP